MYKEKNYKLWYRMSAALLIAAVLVHISGYFTNMLYVLAWVLWMPVIGLFVICFLDYYTALRLKPAISKRIFSRESIKTPLFAIMCVVAAYVIFNFIYGFAMLSEAGDLQTIEGIYYSVKGDTMTEISYEKYVSYALTSYRLLSGHSLIFVAIPVWYFGVRADQSI